jgi:hypothetical protein
MSDLKVYGWLVQIWGAAQQYMNQQAVSTLRVTCLMLIHKLL